ncbi:tenascin-like isoform X2 [Trichoplusia ni]|uniref:Tenascin-like isoform X2 n=1 Tax=Trichoplusia ni TaxID=7111 RepID=A0A7E5WYC4_TRINI|nr:tenascin-like isoform X2 [Trichoplusia ni]
MWSKFVVMLAVSCVANASVIINVFDEVAEIPEIKSVQLEECNTPACDQRCRHLGFTGGICVRDRCKCDINRREDPEIPAMKSVHVGDCNPQWCDQQCRNMGFTGGVCVQDRCKCDINRREVPEIEQSLSELAKSVYILDCNPQGCDQQCRNMGFTGGVCVHDRCKCDINRKADGTAVPEIERASKLAKSVDLLDCNLQWCDQQCRNMGFTGGVCVHDRCKCDINRKVPETIYSFVDLAKSLYPRNCDSTTCDEQCYKYGFPKGGFCIDGNCESSPPVSEEARIVKEEKQKEGKPFLTLPRACDIFACNDMCQRLNYVGGTCDIDGQCQCF